jgi:hypothetical protein
VDIHQPKYKYVYKVRAGGKYASSSSSSGPKLDFGQKEIRDGKLTKGAYFVELPDGRLQRVKYYVNGKSGYVAQVSYKGGNKKLRYTAEGPNRY